ncbi:MAG: glycogen/starch/alpha-glucan phosphorylase [Clostridia bacterium]|nr:glycogen/starch/alpha-glucan phosphorylase [Clostridia bacterium]
MSKKYTEKEVNLLLTNMLEKQWNVDIAHATQKQIYTSLALIVKDMLLEKREEYNHQLHKDKGKRVHYLCMEFLLGRTLKTSLFNLKLDKQVEKILKEHNVELEDIYELEPDAGLGNGGLGRLAACFLDSLASLDYSSMGYCIRYDYGLFKQKIVENEQVELPDVWLPGGEVWLQPRPDKACIVRFDGYVNEVFDSEGRMVPQYYDYTEVQAYPYDMMISGYDSDGVAVLRLYRAKSITKFDMKMFGQGEYVKAIAEDSQIEMISKVLYPADDHEEGKSLRLKQQYFLVSASLQNIVSNHIDRYKDIYTLPDYQVIHINDTHPALCVPELMRILMDDYNLEWDDAWNIVTRCVNYTNHTVLSEALEKWNEDLVARRLPRIYQIIREINRRFCKNLMESNKFGMDEIEKMAIISQRQIRMANLSVVASGKVNGVSGLHSDILKKTLFKEFFKESPDKFINVTNGITHRRWLCQSNPELEQLLTETIGDSYYKNPVDLKKFRKFADDKSILSRLGKIKYNNKVAFAKYLQKTQGVVVNPNTRFDVQVKRIHEYKRQLLNVLKIIHLYHELKANPEMEFTPQTYFFGGKAAAKYYHAKRIIRLINQLGSDIESHPEIAKKLKVVFLENYCVTMAEKLMPASEVSEQISLAGKEASGTGNMKFMINGALTLGTYDGANVEMTECCGRDNIFIFGKSDKEVESTWKMGYNPRRYYEENPRIRAVIDELVEGFNGESFGDIADYLLGSHNLGDPYMCLADFDSYIATYEKMDEAYQNPNLWNKMSLFNIASAGFFAGDRTIEEYANKIWHLDKHKVK